MSLHKRYGHTHTRRLTRREPDTHRTESWEEVLSVVKISRANSDVCASVWLRVALFVTSYTSQPDFRPNTEKREMCFNLI